MCGIGWLECISQSLQFKNIKNSTNILPCSFHMRKTQKELRNVNYCLLDAEINIQPLCWLDDGKGFHFQIKHLFSIVSKWIRLNTKHWVWIGRRKMSFEFHIWLWLTPGLLINMNYEIWWVISTETLPEVNFQSQSECELRVTWYFANSDWLGWPDYVVYQKRCNIYSECLVIVSFEVE